MTTQKAEIDTSASTSLRKIHELPGPFRLPLIGNLHQISPGTLHLTLEKWADQYGDIFRVYFGPRPFVVITECETTQRILRDRPKGFRRTSILEKAATDMHLNGVFSREGELWQRHRVVVTKSLNRTKLKPLFPKLQMMVERLKRCWDHSADQAQSVDVRCDLMRFTVDVTMQVAFGIDPNTQETEGPVIQRHLDKVFPMLHRLLFLPFPVWRYIRLPSNYALNSALKALREEVDEMVWAVRQKMEADPRLKDSPTNFLESILSEIEQGDSDFSDEDVFANAVTLLLAGEDTTANSIAWCIHYLMRYPEHFQRVRSEVDELAASNSGATLELEQTNRLPFLDAFVNEVMRLKPVAPLIAAEANFDTEILGCQIPRGTTIHMLTRKTATKDSNFINANQFEPERWLNADTQRYRPHERQAFIPFGSGPRLCPGRNLALFEIRMVLSMLCRNFDLDTIHGTGEVNERLAFTMMPENLTVNLRKRRRF